MVGLSICLLQTQARAQHRVVVVVATGFITHEYVLVFLFTLPRDSAVQCYSLSSLFIIINYSLPLTRYFSILTHFGQLILIFFKYFFYIVVVIYDCLVICNNQTHLLACPFRCSVSSHLVFIVPKYFLLLFIIVLLFVMNALPHLLSHDVLENS